MFISANSDKIKFPDPKDFRIAIVESTNCIHLRIGFLPNYEILPETVDAEVDVTLILAIEFQGWPRTTDFPSRIPLSHIDALFFQNMATTVRSISTIFQYCYEFAGLTGSKGIKDLLTTRRLRSD